MPKTFEFLFLLAAICTSLLMAGCGGGGGESSSGTLDVSIFGLPAGTQAAINVTGPNSYSTALTGSKVLADLAPGLYMVAAQSVLVGNTTYAPTPASQSVTVNVNGTTTTRIDYAVTLPLTLKLQQIAGGLTNPVFLTAPPNDNRLFIVEQRGRVLIVQNGQVLATPFLDISSKISSGGERGLLSMAFHPQYASNGWFFVYFTDLNGDITVERFSVSANNPNLAANLAVPIISIPHRFAGNHNGGLLAFGPDGMLYLGTGDGGGGGDPQGNAQNNNSLLGKMLRLDVSTLPYTIPSSNPFVGQVARRGEIWAFGLRNPWRYAFDRVTNLLYIADVGQNAREEVNVVTTGAAGLNYGWNITEGTLCYPADPCTVQGITLPIVEYAHSEGCSITGGYVYRGTQIPEIAGHYFYSDFCAGWLKSFRFNNGVATEQRSWGVPNVGNITSFGEDSAGELYLLAASGSIYRIMRQ